MIVSSCYHRDYPGRITRCSNMGRSLPHGAGPIYGGYRAFTEALGGIIWRKKVRRDAVAGRTMKDRQTKAEMLHQSLPTPLLFQRELDPGLTRRPRFSSLQRLYDWVLSIAPHVVHGVVPAHCALTVDFTSHAWPQGSSCSSTTDTSSGSYHMRSTQVLIGEGGGSILYATSPPLLRLRVARMGRLFLMVCGIGPSICTRDPTRGHAFGGASIGYTRSATAAASCTTDPRAASGLCVN